MPLSAGSVVDVAAKVHAHPAQRISNSTELPHHVSMRGVSYVSDIEMDYTSQYTKVTRSPADVEAKRRNPTSPSLVTDRLFPLPLSPPHVSADKTNQRRQAPGKPRSCRVVGGKCFTIFTKEHQTFVSASKSMWGHVSGSLAILQLHQYHQQALLFSTRALASVLQQKLGGLLLSVKA